MEIKEDRSGATLTLALEGRLDAMAALELDKKLRSALDGVAELILDFTGVAYIASAGVRVIVQTQKTMTDRQGKLILRHVNPAVREIFEITRLVKFLQIEA